MDDDLIFIPPPEDGMLRCMCVVENQNKYVDPRGHPINTSYADKYETTDARIR